MGSAITETLNKCTVVVIVWVLSKVVEFCQLLWYGFPGIKYDAAPQGTLIEGL